uniref:SRCR domain-containing protein n=1 Tax=Cyprinus carpio TaxID=7962 RepID=A0A8C1XNW1_CYPCA
HYLDSVNVRLVNGSSRCAGRVEVLHRGQWGTVCEDRWDLADAAVVFRLVGGSRCSGRLEILHNQTWMSVCDAVFDQQDAEVVCRELDCGAPVQVLGAAAFGKGDAQMWTQEIQCRGNESQIHLCPTSLSHENNCSRCSGRLEILHNQTWMSVCDAAFDQQDAEVVCRELDCGAPVQVLGAAAFGKGDTQMWTQEIQCRGNESFILLCPTSHDIQCSQENNVGLICSDFETVRLVGGNSSCSGRVEVLYRGQWGTVCHNHWDKTDVEVVCRELDCGEALNAVSNVLGAAAFGKGDTQMWTQEIQCRGNESLIRRCPSSTSNNINCTHDNHIYIHIYSLHWMRRGTTQQIPDRKLLLCSIYDVLTQISNDFQRLLCHLQRSRQTLVVAAHRTKLWPVKMLSGE